MIDIPLPIFTPRLEIRAVDPVYASLVQEAQVESWPELSRWNIWAFMPTVEELTVEKVQEFCSYKQEKFSKREDLTMFAFHRVSGKFIGVVGLHFPDWENRVFTLGFWVRSSETRKGYATEMGTALAQYAFDTLGSPYLVSHHETGNGNSQATLKKLGFVFEETRDNMDHYQLAHKGLLPVLDLH